MKYFIIEKKAQAQISKSTAVADEAINNVRTVRAFAMEDAEREMFECEVEKARLLNVRLSLGIGLFQGASNFFINGVVLGVLYAGNTRRLFYLLQQTQIFFAILLQFFFSISPLLTPSFSYFFVAAICFFVL